MLFGVTILLLLSLIKSLIELTDIVEAEAGVCLTTLSLTVNVSACRSGFNPSQGHFDRTRSGLETVSGIAALNSKAESDLEIDI